MKTWVQLGRYGDIINILPLLRSEEAQGRKCRLMVASEFSSILDGISYVEPCVYDGPYHELDRACEKAAEFGEFVCTQVNAPPEMVREFTYQPAGYKVAQTTSFVKESWRAAGMLNLWDQMLPLEFDQRSPEREAKLCKEVLKQKKGKRKPTVLVSIGGVTSPFIHRDLIWTLLRLKFEKKFQLVDLSTVKAERIYDLIGLFEQAHCLIANDSAPLHLAYACPKMPVLALVNDKPIPWNGSPWRPSHIFHCRYSDFTQRTDLFLRLVEEAEPLVRHREPVNFLVVSAWESRVQKKYSQIFRVIEVLPGMVGRDASMMMGDEKKIPYLKDCLRMGLQCAWANDYVIIARPNVELNDSNTLLYHQDACFSYRMLDGKYWPIVDLFCAKKSWWEKVLPEIPDYLLGPDYFWSHGLWALFQKHGATEVFDACQAIIKPNAAPNSP